MMILSALKKYLSVLSIVVTAPLFAQNVGINTTTPAAKLHIKGSANNSQLIIDAYSPQSNTSPLIKLRSNFGSDLLWIHSDTSFNTFIGLNAGRVNNAVGGALYNTFIGRDVGYSNTSGSFNSAFGKGALYTNTTGSYNTASGEGALFSNTTGTLNSAYGHLSLNSNTTGFLNSAHGYGSLFSNTTGKWNSAYGSRTLFSNTTGVNNSALGIDALYSNINGAGNTAIGYSVLYANTSGYLNSAKGYLALRLNTMGYENTAVGPYAMFSNTTGSQNTALGLEALISNTTGTYNTAIGSKANVASGELNNATAIGANASVATSNSIVLGSIAGVNGATESTNVGIGTVAPNAKLQVNGTFKVVDGTQGTGKVLTSDATGLASWQPPPPPPGTNDPSVSICCQRWMTKNLDVATYRNGDPIPKVTDNSTWAALTSGAYCYYNNDSTMYAATYGKLYNWYAVNDPRGLAPEGWYIPTDFEWTALGNCLGGDIVAGGPLKEANITHWTIPNTGATNISGFRGLPGGRRLDSGPFDGIGTDSYLWSSTENTSNSWSRALYYNSDALVKSYNSRRSGFTVRCIRD